MFSCGTYPLMLIALVCSVVALGGSIAALLTDRWFVIEAGGQGWKEFSLSGVCDAFSLPPYQATTTTTTTQLPTSAPPYSAQSGSCTSYADMSTFSLVMQFVFRTSEATSASSVTSPYECAVPQTTISGYFATTKGLFAAGVTLVGSGVVCVVVDGVRWVAMRVRVRRNIAKRRLRMARRLARRRRLAAASAIEFVQADSADGDSARIGVFESRTVDDRRIPIPTVIAAVLLGLGMLLFVAGVAYFASIFGAKKLFCDGDYGTACELLAAYDGGVHFSECEAFYGYSYSLGILAFVASTCAFVVLLCRISAVKWCRVSNIIEEELVDGDEEDSEEEELGALHQEELEGSSSSLSATLYRMSAPRPGSTAEEQERYRVNSAIEHQNKQFNPVELYRQGHAGGEEADDVGLAALTTGQRPPEDDGVEDLDIELPQAANRVHAVPLNASGAPKHPSEPADVDLPDGRWEWDPEAELFWSEEKEYFFDHQSGQFYDPDTEQWYNRQTGKWYSL